MSEENNAQAQTEPQAQTKPQAEPQQPQQAQPDNAQQAVNPYQSIIDGQNEQIAALIAANEALTKQVTNMIQSGAQLGGTQPVAQPQQAQPTAQLNTPSLASNDDWSLEDLAKEIGKK